MADPYAETLPAVAAGRVALVAELRALADRVEQLPLDAVAELLMGDRPDGDPFPQEPLLVTRSTPATSRSRSFSSFNAAGYAV
jgi:hypothetical protein